MSNTSKTQRELLWGRVKSPMRKELNKQHQIENDRSHPRNESRKCKEKFQTKKKETIEPKLPKRPKQKQQDADGTFINRQFVEQDNPIKFHTRPPVNKNINRTIVLKVNYRGGHEEIPIAFSDEEITQKRKSN